MGRLSGLVLGCGIVGAGIWLVVSRAPVEKAGERAGAAPAIELGVSCQGGGMCAIGKRRLSWMDDPEWSKPIANRGEGRDLRYGVAGKKPEFSRRLLSWKGGGRMGRGEIEDLARQVFRLLPHIRTTDETVSLVAETAIVESDGGRHVRNKYGDLGMFQIKAWVSVETREWLRSQHPDIYAAIEALRDKNRNEEENLIANLPYAAAMCVTCYWHKAGSGFSQMIGDLPKRAELWKSVYNTRKGKGTVRDYIERTRNYSI